VDTSSDRLSEAKRASPAPVLAARDRELLGFIAQHRLVLDCHVQSLLGSRQVSDARLRALEKARLIRQGPRFHGQPRCYQITRAGLDLTGSSLPEPRIDLREYKHDVGVAWLWLAAGAGAFGQIQAVVSERALRSGDMTADGRERPLGVRLGGVGPRGRERLHYPDLLLVDRGARRIAIELELTPKGVSRRDRILAGYAGDPRIDAALYLVEDPRIGRKVEASARALGASALIHVRRIHIAGFCADGAPEPGASRTRSREATERRKPARETELMR
jgi:hypothetical protein